MCSSVFDQTTRSHVPLRYDACKLLISGVVGTEPKEIYLKSGHYVVNFALAVVGHYKAIHQQELYKPTETMWLAIEMWDELAKKNYAHVKKGRPVRGMGYVIQNKWTDKDTGEERKMYKVRITKVLSSEEFDSVQELLEDSDGTRESHFVAPATESGFASDFPDLDDQSSSSRYGVIVAASNTEVGTSVGYTYRKRSTPNVRAPSPAPQPVLPIPEEQTPRQLDAFSTHDSQYLDSSQVPPPGSGGGQKVWESLKNAYPGMIKAKDNTDTTGPEWG